MALDGYGSFRWREAEGVVQEGGEDLARAFRIATRGELARVLYLQVLALVLSETSERFAARAIAEGKDLRVDHAGKLPARGDAERTGQILAALLDNALRFTPTGGTVTVDGRVADKRIEAGVTDTGPGIASESLDRVFERFYRADTHSAARTRGPSGGGTGLGLAIARDLARAQGGELLAGSAENGGARFTLTLPSGP